MADKKPILNDKSYRTLKWTVVIVLPAAATLYFALSQIWGLPYGEEVIGTITAVEIFLGAIIGVSNEQYKNSSARFDGHLNVVETPEKRTYNLALNEDPETLTAKKEVLFEVRDAQK